MKHLNEHYNQQLQRIDEFVATGATIITSAILMYALSGGSAGGYNAKDDWFLRTLGGDAVKRAMATVGVVAVGIGALLYSRFTEKGRRERAEKKLQAEVDKKKAELEHEKKMKDLQAELDELNGKSPSKSEIEDLSTQIQDQVQANNELGFSNHKVVAMAAKEIENNKDPKQKESQKGVLDIIRCGNSTKDPKQWLGENISEDDLKDMVGDVGGSIGDTSFDDDFKKKIQESAASVTPEDERKEKETSESVYKDLGKKLEEDAAKRKEYKTQIDQKQAEQQTKLAKFDEQILDASNDEDKKKLQTDKLKYQKESDAAIYLLKEEAAKFETTCESSKALNTAIPNRQKRCEDNIKSIQEEAKQKAEQYDKELGIEPNDSEDQPKPDDEKNTDVETDDDKKAIQNPAKVWHKKKNKVTGKQSKSYYDKKGNSISADEFKKKMDAFRERQKKATQNESIKSFRTLLNESMH